MGEDGGKMNRWDTKFAEWISKYGVGKLVKDLEILGIPITRGTVYQWAAGKLPRKKTLEALVTLSEGELQISDIFEHGSRVSNKTPGRLPRICKAGAR